MSATPEREQAEAAFRAWCAEAGYSDEIDPDPDPHVEAFFGGFAAAVSRLEAERDEARRELEWGNAVRTAALERHEELALELHAAVERERELTRALGLASSAFAHEVDGQHAKAARLISAAREALAGGVSAAGRPPEQDLGGNAVAVAEAGE